MAVKKKVYGSTSNPRYRAKMYDFMSKGGRIPMVLAMEVVDAMGASWEHGFGKYRGYEDEFIATAFEKAGIPKPYYGLCRAIGFLFKKLTDVKGLPKETAVEMIIQMHRLTGDDPISRFLQELAQVEVAKTEEGVVVRERKG